MKLAPIGLHHTILVQPIKNSPGEAVPVLYLKHRDGRISVHAQLHEYLLENRNTCLNWKRDTARAVGLFWDFVTEYAGSTEGHSPTNLHRTVFRQFCRSLQFGTINVETKLDPLGLHWPSFPIKQAKKYVSALETFITWTKNNAAGTGGQFDLSTLARLPEDERHAYPTDSATSMRFLIVAKHRQSVSMLHHLKDVAKNARRLERVHDQEKYLFGDSGKGAFSSSGFKHMEPEIVAAMVKFGFVKNPNALALEDRENITAKLAFLLQAFGGLRISEPYQLWFNDIIPEGNFTSKGFLRHPAHAKTYILGEKGTRREYLARLGLVPRNENDIDTWYHAGWKKLATDDSYTAPIHWLHPGAQALFTSLYNYYLSYRSRLLERRRLRGKIDHPFLLVSDGEDRAAGISHIGEPYSINAFDKAFNIALELVSKELGVHIVRDKNSGNSPHGFRHFYAQTLINASEDKKVVQKALRHRSVLSQEPYTVADYKRVTAVMNAAQTTITNGNVRGMDLSCLNSVFS